MSQIALHPLLRYSYHSVAGNTSPIVWDLRQSPASFVRLAGTEGPIPLPYLTEFATAPPVPYLPIKCEVFPFPWPIEAKNPRGVTVLDVLQTVYNVAQKPIKQHEWDSLSAKHRERVEFIFEQRWRSSQDPWRERSRGVIRADCLLHSTSFAGFSMSLGRGFFAILTLSRNSRYPYSTPIQRSLQLPPFPAWNNGVGFIQ